MPRLPSVDLGAELRDPQRDAGPGGVAGVVTSFEHQAQQIGLKTYERDIKSHLEWMKQEGFGYLMLVILMAACTWRYLDGHVTIGVVSTVFVLFGIGALRRFRPA